MTNTPAPELSPPAASGRAARSATTTVLVLLTVLAGMLSPMQSAVNGALGATVGDGNSAAVISFGSGLVLMLVIVFARPATRKQALSIPRLIRSKRIGWWNYLAGLCGGAVVLSEGVSVGVLGVAVFQITLIAGLVISGVICDRIGVTATVKQPISVTRGLGALLAVAATAVTISPNFHVPHAIALAVLPFAAGLLAGWQPAGNAAVARETGSMLVSITFNFLVGFVVLLAGLLVRLALGTGQFSLPPTWWMYTGGVLGLLSIGFMALLVRGLGLLLLGLGSVAGQLVGSLLLDLVVPSVGHPIHLATVIGTVLALIAAGIGMIPSRSADAAGAAR
ncbi:transporter family-2 protein [Saccharopolyspora kobensis]|uniref:Transporter family-2 protein n=1 Tax=Saccharopolyspora kobensis TaxID=146035 RepID=A0A1H5SVC0_9PSEU|nr:DMT family transporter [Saccharopolyspora kobensis]SEF53811.1 transporter family-2 protein [Saccharopolyspora kobensis]SFC53641.1 transporter family-2 protein [Saccharopolyspora kobensis]